MEEEGLLREIGDDIRRERYQQIWTKYRSFIGGFFALIIVATGGVMAYDAYRSAALERDSDLLAKAQDSAGNDFAAQQTDLRQLGETGYGGYPILARLYQAEGMLANGNHHGAAVLFQNVAKTNSEWQDWAQIRATYAEFATLDGDIIRSRLAPLAEGGDVWHVFARELVALADLRDGRIDAARMAFDTLITDPDVPAQMRERAFEMRNFLLTAPEE